MNCDGLFLDLRILISRSLWGMVSGVFCLSVLVHSVFFSGDCALRLSPVMLKYNTENLYRFQQ